jgi:hypothetical protein
VDVNSVTGKQDASCCVLGALGDSLPYLVGAPPFAYLEIELVRSEHTLSDGLDLIQRYFASIKSFGGGILIIRVDLVIRYVNSRETALAGNNEHAACRRLDEATLANTSCDMVSSLDDAGLQG